MGGFFSSGTPSTPAPVTIAASSSTTDDETKARQETIDRNRRGLYGTIATSDTGLLVPRSQGGKSLLGE
jgi:hypothetical protein